MSNQPTVTVSWSPPKVEVPRSFELYVDGAKWLLAIIAGLLAYGFAALKEHPDGLALAFFAASAVCLSVAAGCALYYLLMSYTYLSRREGGKTYEEAKYAKTQSNYAFEGMLWTFAVGLLLFVMFGASQLSTLQPSNEAVTVHVSTPRNVVIQRGDRLWVWVRTSDGRARWHELPSVPEN